MNVSCDLSGWEFRGLGYTFPAGSVIGPTNYLVLAANRASFAGAYGATIPVFDTYPGKLQLDGELLSLVKPGTNIASDLLVTRVRYSSALPWPGGPNGLGSSLQLIDPRQDNWRAGNWSGGFPPAALSPGRSNTVLVAMPLFQPLWLNEIQADNLTAPPTALASEHPGWSFTIQLPIPCHLMDFTWPIITRT